MNVAVVRSAPGCLHYAKGCINIERHSQRVAFPSTIEIMGTQDTDPQGLRDEEKTHDNVLQDEENTHFDPLKVNFKQEQPEQEIELEQVLFADAQADLLHWHYRLNHLPFKCIQNMA